MKTQRYKLLTTLIVSALHPNEPHPAGTAWAPTNRIDVLEAEDLVNAGYAERNSGKGDEPLASLVLDRKEAARKRQAAIDRGEDPDAVEGTVTTPVVEGGGNDDDEVLTLILAGNGDQVEAELDGLTVEQLRRLDELENGDGGKGRKGVTEAIAKAITEAEKSE